MDQSVIDPIREEIRIIDNDMQKLLDTVKKLRLAKKAKVKQLLDNVQQQLKLK